MRVGRRGDYRTDALGQMAPTLPQGTAPSPYGQHHSALGMVQGNHVGQMSQHTVAGGQVQRAGVESVLTYCTLHLAWNGNTVRSPACTGWLYCPAASMQPTCS